MIKKLIFFILLFALASCNKEDDPTMNEYLGIVTVLKDGKELVKEIDIFDNRVDELDPLILGWGFNTYNTAGELTETFSMTSIKPILEKQFIEEQIDFSAPCRIDCPIHVGVVTWIDGDVPFDIYDVDTTAANNFIHFTSYNSSKAEVEGIFNITMVLTRAGNLPGHHPNSIVFSNGKFTVKVKREWFE